MTFVRYLHLLAMAFFVGGQLVLVAVVPAVRRHGDETVLRAIGLRFGVGSVVALAVLIATGVAMAQHFDLWEDGALQLKLLLVALVGVLTALHAVAPRSRAVSMAALGTSLVVVWLGVDLVS